jgi:CheY-like chemotaxis protein
MSHRILIIDDEDDIREVAALSLETVAGWEVMTANSGAQGLARAIEHQPDAILLDVMMPGMDGPTTFRELRKNPATAASRVAAHRQGARATTSAASPTSASRPFSSSPLTRSRSPPRSPMRWAGTRRIWPVRELVGQVRELVEQEYGDVWVEGEISNFRPAPSGHVYFTLKDADAQLPIVFSPPGHAAALPPRGRPARAGARPGQRLRAARPDATGAETMEPVGAGSLQLAFEQLKERLKAEGLFDADRKQPLPAFPRTVGIVTSPTGAVIRDFLNIVARRHSGLNVLFPGLRAGRFRAGRDRSRALPNSTLPLVDVIVLARGGGSLEDLAAFNSERVARAIASSRLPVVSASATKPTSPSPTLSPTCARPRLPPPPS